MSKTPRSGRELGRVRTFNTKYFEKFTEETLHKAERRGLGLTMFPNKGPRGVEDTLVTDIRLLSS